MTPLFATRNPATASLARTLARLAGTDMPVLLEGETGAGKSFIAQRLHRRGRPGRPLVVVDCAAVPEGLLASELFGHRAGAFTDARTRVGWLERAGEGTVVLDRVDALPSSAQVILLRALEQRSFFAVGGTAAQPLRARVVALALPGLGARVDAGTFRPDLYHRLAGLHGRIPPLRERREDLGPFVARELRRGGRTAALSDEAAALAAAYPWPGNFRELKLALARACLLAEGGDIGPQHLGLPLEWSALVPAAAALDLTAAEATRLYALAVLGRAGGNVTRAAKILGVSRRTLIRWRRG